jgi:opacity protein-like surface antigen
MAQEKAELYGGYSFFRTGTGLASGSSVNANGWDLAMTGKLNRYLGVTAEINGNYADNILGTGSKGSVHNALFGPTVTFTSGRLTPFAHALFGVSHLDGSTISGQNSFAMAYGGGLDVKVAKRLAVRMGQFDYVRTQFNSGSQNHFRYSSGIVLRF